MEQPGDRLPAPGSLALVQDFVNTADLEGGTDQLSGASGLRDFWAAHGGADLGDLPLAAVAMCRDLREALRGACRAHAGVPAPDPSTLDHLLRQGPLVLSGSGGTVLPAPGLSGAPVIVAGLAAAIARGMADGTWVRLKACAADPCQWVYYDRSPAGRSRWCTMAICGSRAKMRAYRKRS